MNLSGNKFSMISRNLPPSVTDLDLSGNHFIHMPPELLDRPIATGKDNPNGFARSLTKINLSRNHISYIRHNIEHIGSVTLDLRKNPLTGESKARLQTMREERPDVKILF